MGQKAAPLIGKESCGMALPLRVVRGLSLFLLPAGPICVGFPFYALTLPAGGISWATRGLRSARGPTRTG